MNDKERRDVACNAARLVAPIFLAEEWKYKQDDVEYVPSEAQLAVSIYRMLGRSEPETLSTRSGRIQVEYGAYDEDDGYVTVRLEIGQYEPPTDP